MCVAGRISNPHCATTDVSDMLMLSGLTDMKCNCFGESFSTCSLKQHPFSPWITSLRYIIPAFPGLLSGNFRKYFKRKIKKKSLISNYISKDDQFPYQCNTWGKFRIYIWSLMKFLMIFFLRIVMCRQKRGNVLFFLQQ
jgi:hypothetical protein